MECGSRSERISIGSATAELSLLAWYTRGARGKEPARLKILQAVLACTMTIGKREELMESIWNISLIVLWGVVLVNLLLTLRMVRWRRAIGDAQKQAKARETLPELAIDAPAPKFRARTLTGQQVQLATYTGQSVLFIFVSPHCGSCRKRLPLFTKLRPLAKEHSGVEFILVSDSSATETYAWVESIRNEDKVEVDFPILLDPPVRSGFLGAYNPRGIIPYFCLIDARGIVQTRGLLGTEEWFGLQREWESPTALSSFSSRER